MSYYKELGYQIDDKEYIFVDVKDLPISSHVKIDVKCDSCGKEKTIPYQKYTKNINNCNFYACCAKCAKEKIKKTSIEKFGKEHYSQTEEYEISYKKSVKEKYGVEHHTQNNDVKEKSKNTCLEKYGVEYYTQTDEYKEKYKNTCLEKYGVENTFQSEKFKNKIKETNLEKYGVENIMYLDKNKNRISKISREIRKNYILEKHKNIKFNEIDYKNNNFNIHCDKCDMDYNITPSLFKNRTRTDSEICLICNPLNYGHTSDKENKLYNFIKENYNGEILQNKRKIISPYELDIYIPEMKLAFEFNGVYWHSELYKDKDYHLNKTESCLENDISLIHIWEDDWYYKQEIVKSMILNKIGMTTTKIYARKTEVKEVIDNKLIRPF